MLSLGGRFLARTNGLLHLKARGFVKDVYKDINYEAPFEKGEKDIVLQKVHVLPERNQSTHLTNALL